MSKIYVSWKNVGVYQAFVDWTHLLNHVQARPTHVKELLVGKLTDVCDVDASGEGVGGVWFSLTNSYTPIVWRIPWPTDITTSIISTGNKTGHLTNSDLELAGILLSWLIQE